MPRTVAEAAEALLTRATRNADGCLVYTGALDAHGYCQARADGRVQLGHRMIYAATVGPIPSGQDVDHACHNRSDCPGGRTCPHRACLDREHLDLATRRENTLRSARTNASRNAATERCPQDHPYDETNTYRHGQRRGCRACNRASVARYKAARKATR